MIAHMDSYNFENKSKHTQTLAMDDQAIVVSVENTRYFA